MVVTCENCGGLCKKTVSELVKNASAFCSRACFFAARRRIRIDKNCKICGVTFSVRPSEDRKYSTCSKECYLAAKQKEKNGNWKGGITEDRQCQSATARYKEWRISVFERDNYTCIDCGQHGGDLEADHIKPWAYFPELRFELANGAARCIPCHRKRTAEVFKWRTQLLADGSLKWNGPQPKVQRVLACAECGQEFVPRSYNRVFCTSRCQGRNWWRKHPDKRPTYVPHPIARSRDDSGRWAKVMA